MTQPTARPMRGETIQQHPHYHEGFYDAMDGEPIFDDCMPKYRAGWEAFWECKDILARAQPEKH